MAPTTRRQTVKNRPMSQKMPQTNYNAEPDKASKNWTDKEVESMLLAMFKYGHMDYENILKQLPGRDLKQYQDLLRAKRRLRDPNQDADVLMANLTQWIERCQVLKDEKAPNGPLQIATVLKLLSHDGVFENHPLPEDADGIDYGACYRTLYQAVLGHPLQPLNRETYDELYDQILKVGACTLDNAQHKSAFSEVTDFFAVDETPGLKNPDSVRWPTRASHTSHLMSASSASASPIQSSLDDAVSPQMPSFSKTMPSLDPFELLTVTPQTPGSPAAAKDSKLKKRSDTPDVPSPSVNNSASSFSNALTASDILNLQKFRFADPPESSTVAPITCTPSRKINFWEPLKCYSKKKAPGPTIDENPSVSVVIEALPGSSKDYVMKINDTETQLNVPKQPDVEAASTPQMELEQSSDKLPSWNPLRCPSAWLHGSQLIHKIPVAARGFISDVALDPKVGI